MKKDLLLLLAVFVIAGASYVYAPDLQGAFSTSATLKKPDLTISSIKVDESGLLSIKMANIGTKDVPTTDGAVSIYIDDLSSAKDTYSWTTLSDVNFLKAGNSTTLSPEILSNETYYIKACIDSSSKVMESDESNNCLVDEVEVGDYLEVADDYDPFQGVGVGNLSADDILVDRDGTTDGSKDVLDGPGSIYWSDTGDAPVDGQCFLSKSPFASGAINRYNYVSFWMKSSQTDTKLSDFGIYLGVDEACSVTGDEGEVVIDLASSGVLYDGSPVSAKQAISPTAGEWHLISVPLSGATDANKYVGFTLTAPTTFGQNDDVWFDDVSLHN